MRDRPDPKIEPARVLEGDYASKPKETRGAFLLKTTQPKTKRQRRDRTVRMVIVSSGADDPNGWEHVSVSVDGRMPTWEEMSWAKKAFWRDDEVVVEFHVDDDRKVDNQPWTLHLWRHPGADVVLPPRETV